jgi:hypothetical protein
MYSHMLKGFTVGKILGRRLMRGLMGLPGLAIDAAVAVTWTSPTGKYLAYWDEATMTYADNTKVGFFQGLSGWIGDIAGSIGGAVIGTFIGTALYVPDSILRVLCWAHDKIHEGCDALSNFVGTHSGFEHFAVFDTSHPSYNSTMYKAGNIAAVTLGSLIAAPFYLVAKAIEFFIPPIKDHLSNACITIGSFVGNCIGVIALIGILPVKHICNNAVKYYNKFRDSVRSMTAWLYAKAGEEAMTQINRDSEGRPSSCLPDIVSHSPEFRSKITEYKNMTTTQLLFGEKISSKDTSTKITPPVAIPVAKQATPSAPALTYGAQPASTIVLKK